MCALVATVATSVQTLAWPPGSNTSAPTWKASLWENDSGSLCFLAVEVTAHLSRLHHVVLPSFEFQWACTGNAKLCAPLWGTQVSLSGLGQHLSYAPFLRTSMHLGQHLA